MPGWGREQGGDAEGGCPERARGRSAHPRVGPSRRSGRPAPTGSPRPLCRAPLCAARNAAAPWRPREHARRAGAGGTRSGTVRAAAAACPARTVRRPRTPTGRRDGAAGAAGRLCGACWGSALTLGRAAAGDGSASRRGCQSGAGGGDWSEMRSGARKAGGAAARRDAAPGVCKWSEPSGGGGGGGRERTETGPAARGRSAASLTVHGAVRGSRCPGAGGGPDALGVHPGWRAAFLAVRGVEPGVLAVASDRLSLFIANISHAEFALALSVSWAATLVRTCVPKHFFFTRCFYRGKSLITRVACLEEFYMPRLTRQCTK